MESRATIYKRENRTGMGIWTSERPVSKRVPTGAHYPMRYGDRILVTLEGSYGESFRFVSCELSDMTEVFGEVRHRCRGMVGLGKLRVRNATEGWCMERPLRLYGPMVQTRGFGNVRVNEVRVNEPAPEPRMLQPWETH